MSQRETLRAVGALTTWQDHGTEMVQLVGLPVVQVKLSWDVRCMEAVPGPFLRADRLRYEAPLG